MGGGGGVQLPRKESAVLGGHEGAVLAVRFNGDGNYCLSCGKDRTLRLWNPHRGIHIKTYKSHGREVRDVHVTQDNAKLCSCGGDRQIFYWDVSSGRVIRKFRGHDSEVNAVKFNEYGAVVISAGYDRSLRAWDCRSQSTEPIQIIDTFTDSVMSLCLTKNELIAGSVDGTVRTFDIRMGRELVDHLGRPVNCVSLSNDGNCVLAGSLDSTIRLLDRSSGEILQEYKGHICKSFKMDCCLTNNDAHVTGGSEDGYIYFWDLVDASVVSKFQAHASVSAVGVIGLVTTYKKDIVNNRSATGNEHQLPPQGLLYADIFSRWYSTCLENMRHELLRLYLMLSAKKGEIPGPNWSC